MGEIHNNHYQVGRVEPDGKVYNNHYQIGHVEPDGKVHNNHYQVGHVEPDGKVYNNHYQVGRVESTSSFEILAGGATLLLLIIWTGMTFLDIRKT